MADPLSVASGIAGIVTLGAAVLEAGYKYLSSARASRKDVSQLLHAVAALNTILSRLVAHSASPSSSNVQTSAFAALASHGTLRQCETALQGANAMLTKYKHVDGQSATNLAKSLAWPLKERTINSLIAKIQSLQDACEAALVIDNAAALQRLEAKLTQLTLDEQHRDQEHTDLGRDLITAHEKTFKAVTALGSTLDDMQSRKVLRWISHLEPHGKHEATLSLRQPGTGAWVFNEPQFQDWLKRGGSLWIHASSGVGKTVLASTIINTISKSDYRVSPDELVMFHYCDFTNLDTLDAVKLIGSLVRQFCEQTSQIPARVQAYYESHLGHEHDLQALVHLLAQLIEEAPGRCYIILDGLDECTEREPFFQALLGLHQTVTDDSKIGLLLTSRPEYDIQRAFASFPSLTIQAQHVVADIEVHIKAEFARLPKLNKLSRNVKDQVISELSTRAHGMFRWVQCQLDTLNGSRNLTALHQALKELPVGLEKTYDRMFEAVDEKDVRYVQRTFHWLLESARPLTLNELVEAIVIDPEGEVFDSNERLLIPDEIFDICKSLIRVHLETRIVTLAHYSVMEYLTSPNTANKEHRLARFAINPSASTRTVSMALLSYAFSVGLQLQSLSDKSAIEDFVLLQYTRNYSFYHFERDQTGALQAWVRRLLNQNEKQSFQNMLSMIHYYRHNASNTELQRAISTVHCSAEYSLMSLLEYLLMMQVNRQISSEDAELLRICGTSIVQLQHSRNGSVDFEDFVDNDECPLSAAAAYGFHHLQRFLLEHEAAIDVNLHFRSLGNALVLAAWHGQKDSVKILINHGANINSRSGFYCTALHAAAVGSPLLFEYLLELGADTNVVDWFGLTIHYWAVHDTQIRRSLEPYRLRLERLRARDPDHVDLHERRRTVLVLIRQWRNYSGMFNRRLYLCLYLSGMHEEAAILAEQRIIRAEPIEHLHICCDLCASTVDVDILGPRYMCLDCMDTDFCADCHARVRANPEIDICRNHRFAEIPRPCWYTLPPGVVNEKGEALEQVLDAIEQHWEYLQIEDGDEMDLVSPAEVGVNGDPE